MMASVSMLASGRADFGCHTAAFSQRTVTSATGQQTLVAMMVRNLQAKVIAIMRRVMLDSFRTCDPSARTIPLLQENGSRIGSYSYRAPGHLGAKYGRSFMHSSSIAARDS
jgi:hypothetical protein